MLPTDFAHAGQLPPQVPVPLPQLPTLARRVSKLLAIVDPKSKAAVVVADFINTHSRAATVVQPSVRATVATADFASRQRNPLANFDPKSKAALPVSKPSSRLHDSSFACQKPGRHAIAVVDPQTRKQLTKGKKLLTITDPASKQAVRPPVKGLVNSSLVSVPVSQAVYSPSERSVKRTIAIVDPDSKQPVMLPQVDVFAQQASTVGQVRSDQINSAGESRMEAIIAIIDPITSATVQVPSIKPSGNTSSRPAQRLAGNTVDRPKKTLAIVDPATKTDLHATTSATAPVQDRRQ